MQLLENNRNMDIECEVNFLSSMSSDSTENSEMCQKQLSSSCSMNPDASSIIDKKFQRNRSRSMSYINIENCNTADINRIREKLLRTSRLQPTAIRNFNRTQKLTLASLAIVDFMSFCSMSIMAPFFPKEAKDKGLSETMAGFIFSFYALIMVLTSPIFGKILPLVGARYLFYSGIFVVGFCNLLFGALEYVTDYGQFTTFCLIIRGMEALGASAYSTASYVFVVKIFPENINSVLGILETFVGLGMSMGPALGGLLYSLGGFHTPFVTLGVCMIIIIPLNMFLLQAIEELNVNGKSGSLIKLLKVPAVIVTGLVIIVVSSTWAFLDPTLEPHLRQFELSPEKVGLVFLLFSALYGISSPAWGWLSDRIEKQWIMMVIGLLLCTLGLLILGPCPFLYFLPSTLWLNILALSLLGVSVALALLPTFQGVLTSALNGGLHDNLATYSVVAGIWSCMYSLGEVVGPSLGGFLLQHYGFPFAASVMAGMTFLMAILTLIYFLLKESNRSEETTSSDSGIISSWRSSQEIVEKSDEINENKPLLSQSLNTIHQFYTSSI